MKENWHSDVAMKMIDELVELGLPVDWNVVRMGWEGPASLGRQLGLGDIHSFAGKAIEKAEGEELENVATLCTESDNEIIDTTLKKLAPAPPSIAQRIWRAYLLYRLLQKLPSHPIDALSELSDFWAAFSYPDDSPHLVQGRGNSIGPEDYYTVENLERLLAAHTRWLEEELGRLRACESKLSE
jgi:hypothetical protein